MRRIKIEVSTALCIQAGELEICVFETAQVCDEGRSRRFDKRCRVRGKRKSEREKVGRLRNVVRRRVGVLRWVDARARVASSGMEEDAEWWWTADGWMDWPDAMQRYPCSLVLEVGRRRLECWRECFR